MRTTILLAAAAALLSPSLAAYTCPASLGRRNTLQCCEPAPWTGTAQTVRTPPTHTHH